MRNLLLVGLATAGILLTGCNKPGDTPTTLKKMARVDPVFLAAVRQAMA